MEQVVYSGRLLVIEWLQITPTLPNWYLYLRNSEHLTKLQTIVTLENHDNNHTTKDRENKSKITKDTNRGTSPTSYKEKVGNDVWTPTAQNIEQSPQLQWDEEKCDLETKIWRKIELIVSSDLKLDECKSGTLK